MMRDGTPPCSYFPEDFFEVSGGCRRTFPWFGALILMTAGGGVLGDFGVVLGGVVCRGGGPQDGSGGADPSGRCGEVVLVPADGAEAWGRPGDLSCGSGGAPPFAATFCDSSRMLLLRSGATASLSRRPEAPYPAQTWPGRSFSGCACLGGLSMGSGDVVSTSVTRGGSCLP